MPSERHGWDDIASMPLDEPEDPTARISPAAIALRQAAGEDPVLEDLLASAARNDADEAYDQIMARVDVILESTAQGGQRALGTHQLARRLKSYDRQTVVDAIPQAAKAGPAHGRPAGRRNDTAAADLARAFARVQRREQHRDEVTSAPAPAHDADSQGRTGEVAAEEAAPRTERRRADQRSRRKTPRAQQRPPIQVRVHRSKPVMRDRHADGPGPAVAPTIRRVRPASPLEVPAATERGRAKPTLPPRGRSEGTDGGARRDAVEETQAAGAIGTVPDAPTTAHDDATQAEPTIEHATVSAPAQAPAPQPVIEHASIALAPRAPEPEPEVVDVTYSPSPTRRATRFEGIAGVVGVVPISPYGTDAGELPTVSARELRDSAESLATDLMAGADTAGVTLDVSHDQIAAEIYERLDQRITGAISDAFRLVMSEVTSLVLARDIDRQHELTSRGLGQDVPGVREGPSEAAMGKGAQHKGRGR